MANAFDPMLDHRREERAASDAVPPLSASARRFLDEFRTRERERARRLQDALARDAAPAGDAR